MDTMPALFIKILELLSARYSGSVSLEELAIRAGSNLNIKDLFGEHVSLENRNQAAVLEALMQMHNEGLVFLNCITDESFITLKGLLAIDSKVYCN
ncbi:hypothetical protein [Flavobacterium sp. HJSW_4]|uniref:hypothetical protein n=1 Tax=Flavobacterium sp. HJSW_4 TaxID=3344660 RepID=UPI0035F34945